MALSDKFWHEIGPSAFAWEREALDFVRHGLPDHEPFRAWSNFEFIADDGTLNEVDLLVVTPRGFYLVEIKSRPGAVSGDTATWVWQDEARRTLTLDNPLFLANRKAKKLASVLRRQRALKEARLPFLEVLVFLSHETLQCHLTGLAQTGVCLRDRAAAGGKPERKGILAALRQREYPGATGYGAAVNSPQARAISKALEQAGIRRSQRARKVGDYKLTQLLFESATGNYQEWEAEHATISSLRRRIRIYNVARNTTVEGRRSLARAARREAEILSRLEHPNIQRVDSFTEHELGPALIFPHDPEAVRLDYLLFQQGSRLGLEARLSLLRQIAEALQYAHQKKVFHRALSPQSVLVAEGENGTPQARVINWQLGYKEAVSSLAGASQLTVTVHPEQLLEDAAAVYLAPESFTLPAPQCSNHNTKRL